MRLTVFLGMLSAVIVGAVGIYLLLSGLAERPIVVPSLPPATPTPSAISAATPTPAEPPAVTPAPPTPAATPTPVPEGTQVGQRAPRLMLPRLGGGEVDTAAVDGVPLWINFMATWCPECRDELPMMAVMQHQLGDALEIVVVDVGEDEETVAAFMIGLGVELPVALDLDGAAQRQWGAFVLPVHFMIDADGVVADVVFGGAPREVFVEAVGSIVPDAVLPEP